MDAERGLGVDVEEPSSQEHQEQPEQMISQEQAEQLEADISREERDAVEKIQATWSPLKQKLVLVGFFALVLIGAVSVDYYFRYRAMVPIKVDEIKTSGDGEPEVDINLAKPVKPEDLDPLEDILAGKADEQGDVEDDPSGAMVEPGQAKTAGFLKSIPARVARLLGSEKGTLSQVVVRNIVRLLHVGLLIAMIVIIYRISFVNAKADAFTRPTLSAPFTGLTTMERAVFVSLASLGVVQCLYYLYTPSIWSYLPSFVTVWLGWFRSWWFTIRDAVKSFFSDIFGSFSRTSAKDNNVFISFIEAIKTAWQKSFLKRALRRMFPEGTWESAVWHMRRAYGYLIYAPFWMALLVGFHYLHIYDPTALTRIVQGIVPWLVPQSMVKGAMVWLGQGVGGVFAGQPIYALIGTWLLVTVGFAGIARPWRHQTADRKPVDARDQYKRNSWGYVLHILVGLACLVLLVMCYLPMTHQIVRMATGLPLDQALRSAWAVARASMYVGLQAAVRVTKLGLDIVRSLQWPTHRGWLCFLFTIFWNSTTVFALFAVPRVVAAVLDHFKVWRFFDGADDDKKKAAAKQASRIPYALYIAMAVGLSIPLVVNVVFYPLTLIFNVSLPSVFLLGGVYEWFYTAGPLLFAPLYVVLFVFQYSWIIFPKTSKLDQKAAQGKNVKWYMWVWRGLRNYLLPVLKVIALVLFVFTAYFIIYQVFNPQAMDSMFWILDKLVKVVIAFVMWFLQGLSENMQWVYPFTWTFAVAAVFSFLLLRYPQFLDSGVGFLLYLPMFHFLGQFMWLLLALGPMINIQTAVLIGVMGVIHIGTAVGLFVRYWGIGSKGWLSRFVPYVDEFRGLVGDYY